MAEVRDFHVFENLGERSIPSDHAAVRVVVQNPTPRGHQGNRIPSWMSKHPVFCSISGLTKNISTLLTHLAHSLTSKIILQKSRKGRLFANSRKTPYSLGAKLLTASTA